MEDRLIKPAQELGKSTSEYVDLKIDELKLKTARGLSVTLHRILLAVLFLSLGGLVLITAAFGCILLIGQLTGNYAVGAFIVSAFFLVLLILLVLLRKKLFINGLVRMFIGLFFEEKAEEVEED
ncbi:MAG: hypothetical protein ACI39U_03655 [Candidatus Cryptobacteroides sp.]